MGYKEWFVDSGIISPGSVDNDFGGNHYYRCMRLLKGAFDALVQFRTENITNHYRDMDKDLQDALNQLMWSYQMTVSDHLLALSFPQKVIRMVWLWHSYKMFRPFWL